MTILLIDVATHLGGDQKSFIDLCSALHASRSVQVAAAVANGPVYDALKPTGIPLYPLDPAVIKPGNRGILSWLVNLFSSEDPIRQAIHEFKPDIVHANTYEAMKLIPDLPRKRLLFWSVTGLRLSWTETVATASRCARIIAGSTAIDEFLGTALPPAYCGRVRVIRHALNTQVFKPGNKELARKAFQLPPDLPVIGLVADLIPWKRHALFLEMAKIILQQSPEVQFVIAARPYSSEYEMYEKKFREQVAAFIPSENLHWLDNVNQTELLLPAFDLLVHPAFGEASGRAVSEAMATEIPVIAFDSGAIRDLITQYKDGILIRSESPRDFAREAIRLLADPALSATMAMEARLSMLKGFTKEEIAQRMIGEYKNAIAAETETTK
jgi:glycosyltransferase involved in cell wall biosynthesis